MTKKTLIEGLRRTIRDTRDRLNTLSAVLDTLPEDLPGTLSMSTVNSLWVDVQTIDDFKTWRRRLGRRLFRAAYEPYTSDQGVVRYTYSLATEEWPDETLNNEGKYFFPDSTVIPDGLVCCELLINITPSDICRKVKIGERIVDLFRYECGDGETKALIG